MITISTLIIDDSTIPLVDIRQLVGRLPPIVDVELIRPEGDLVAVHRGNKSIDGTSRCSLHSCVQFLSLTLRRIKR